MIKDCLKHLDKNSIKHFGVNFILALVGSWYGVCAGIGASLTKEWHDKNNGGHWCWMDLCSDFAGLILGIGLNLLLI